MIVYVEMYVNLDFEAEVYDNGDQSDPFYLFWVRTAIPWRHVC